jgi:ribose-phosphate pyrophosphokinase
MMQMKQISEERDQGRQYGLYGPLTIFSGTANPELAQEVADRLGKPLGKATIRQFANENVFAKLNESVRGKDVFLIQPTCAGLRNRRNRAGECVTLPEQVAKLRSDEYEQVHASVNDNILELLVLLDTLRRDSAGRLTAVVPYFAYGRTDKKDQPRVPITARLVADMITVAGATRFMTMDLHPPPIQGFFTIPVDDITAFHMLSDYFIEKGVEHAVVVAPDVGATKLGRDFAEVLDVPLAIIEKRRERREGEKTEVLSLIGEVKGMNAIIFDDEIDTAGTVRDAALFLKQEGAKDVYSCVTHAILSHPGPERMNASGIKELVVTNTVPISEEKRQNMKDLKVTVLSVAPLLGEVIRRIYLGISVGEMFNE